MPNKSIYQNIRVVFSRYKRNISPHSLVSATSSFDRIRTGLGAGEAEGQAYLAAPMQPRYDCPCTDLIYQPMLEQFDLQREYDWREIGCSGGGRDFLRVFSENALGIYRENIIGSVPDFALQLTLRPPLISMSYWLSRLWCSLSKML